VQSANGTNESIDRKALDLEFQQLVSELGDIEKTIKFNNQSIFGPVTFTLQTGANATDQTTFTMTSIAITPANTRIDGDDGGNATVAIGRLDSMINSISMSRATLGAIQNRLEFKIQNLDNTAENLQAAESRIRDVDMAQQMTRFTRDNILFQASTAMLAQANALPQSVLQLIG
jgi:flagellin